MLQCVDSLLENCNYCNLQFDTTLIALHVRLHSGKHVMFCVKNECYLDKSLVLSQPEEA